MAKFTFVITYDTTGLVSQHHLACEGPPFDRGSGRVIRQRGQLIESKVTSASGRGPSPYSGCTPRRAPTSSACNSCWRSRAPRWKIKIRHSSALLGALFSHNIAWITDPDFGYEVVDVDAAENAEQLTVVPASINRPNRLYASTGRADVYADEVRNRHRERGAFLKKFGVNESIITAVVPRG